LNPKFELYLPNRVIFDCGSRSQIPTVVQSFGKRVLIIHSNSHPLIPSIIKEIEASSLEVVRIGISGEPTTKSISALLEKTRDIPFDCVLGIGGGSSVDSAKAISALLTNPGEITDYLEVVGKNLPIQNPPIPYIAVPTTSGTGSEATKNAVLSVPESKIKVSLRSPLMIPSVAIIDPELTVSMPASITASTGMDAIIQLIEPFLSIKSNSFTDGLCREGLKEAAESIRKAYFAPDDLSGRIGMCFASLCGGIALANSGLGAVHGFAGVIGGMYPVPHGMVCASLLAGVIRTNLSALSVRKPDDPVLPKCKEVAAILTGSDKALGTDIIGWASDLCGELGIMRLSDFGISRSDFGVLCEKAALSSSMKGNPIQLTSDELLEILEFSY
jgi:alcohol dehydrogenase class IV